MRKEKVFNKKQKADDWNEIDESLIQDLSEHNQEVMRKYSNETDGIAVLKDKSLGIKYDEMCKDKLRRMR